MTKNYLVFLFWITPGNSFCPGGGESYQRCPVQDHGGNDQERMASAVARHAERDGGSHWSRGKMFVLTNRTPIIRLIKVNFVLRTSVSSIILRRHRQNWWCWSCCGWQKTWSHSRRCPHSDAETSSRHWPKTWRASSLSWWRFCSLMSRTIVNWSVWSWR